MATIAGPEASSTQHLTTQLEQLGLSPATLLTAFPSTHPALNPLDVYRAHIADVLAPITGAEAKVIYNSIQWTQTLDRGDMVLPLPALRIKGKKPDEIAKEIADKVCGLDFLVP